MNLLDRYYLRSYVKVFALTAFGVLSLSLIFEGFEQMENLAGVAFPPGAFVKYLILLAPGYLVHAFPMGVLVATLVVLGLSARQGELVAVQSLGGSLRRGTLVFLAAGSIVTGAEYLCTEYLVPVAARGADQVRETEIFGRPPLVSPVGKSFWVRGGSGDLVRFTVAEDERIFDVSIFAFDGKGRFSRRIEAREGDWTGSAWRLGGVRDRVFGVPGSVVNDVEFMEYSGLGRLDRLGIQRPGPDQMNRRDLAEYVRRLDQAGFESARFRVSLAGKLSHPFMNLAMAAMAAGLALAFRAAGGMRAAGLSVVVALLYWGGQSLFVSLGYSGRVEPLVSAWVVPLVFTLAGISLWIRSEGH